MVCHVVYLKLFNESLKDSWSVEYKAFHSEVIWPLKPAINFANCLRSIDSMINSIKDSFSVQSLNRYRAHSLPAGNETVGGHVTLSLHFRISIIRSGSCALSWPQCYQHSCTIDSLQPS